MNYDSVILRLIFTLLQRLRCIYDNSLTGKLLNKFVNWVEEVTANSVTVNYIRNKDFFTKVIKYSSIITFINFIINTPLRWIGKFYNKCEGVFCGSRIFSLVRLMISRFDILVSAALVIIALVPHASWDNLYTTIIVIVLLLLLALKVIIQKYESINIKAVDPLLFVFILTVLFAEVSSIFPIASLRHFIFFMTCFLLVIVIVNSIKTSKALTTLITILLAGVSLTGLYAIYQRIAGVPFDPALTDLALNEGMGGRVFSTMGNPNNYAELLILTVPFFFSLVVNEKNVVKRAIYLLLAVPPVIALFATGSRSSWIGLAVAVIVLTFFKNWRLIPVMVILGILCIPFLKIFSPSIYARIMTIFNPNDTSIGYRGKILATIIPMLKDYWITGLGLGAGMPDTPFMKVLQEYSMVALLDPDKGITTATTPPHTHNLYLQIWIEAGFVGILTFVWFIARMVKNCTMNIYNKTDEQINNILMAGVAAMAGIMVMGMAEHVWFYPRIMLFFWVVAGIILSGLNILARKSEGPKKA